MNAVPNALSTPARFTFVKFVPWFGTATPLFTIDAKSAIALVHASATHAVAAVNRNELSTCLEVPPLLLRPAVMFNPSQKTNDMGMAIRDKSRGQART